MLDDIDCAALSETNAQSATHAPLAPAIMNAREYSRIGYRCGSPNLCRNTYRLIKKHIFEEHRGEIPANLHIALNPKTASKAKRQHEKASKTFRESKGSKGIKSATGVFATSTAVQELATATTPAMAPGLPLGMDLILANLKIALGSPTDQDSAPELVPDGFWDSFHAWVQDASDLDD